MPYVAWSIIYTGIQSTAGFGTWTCELRHLASNLAYGTAWYHLYFLLVSMQIYLLFPLIERAGPGDGPPSRGAADDQRRPAAGRS